jgi:hypothetical protein
VRTVSITLDEALDLARTGDVWLFRGRKAADRAIQVATNSPVNHVGMSVVIGDLPPLMWHAELGRSLPDLWSGTRHRGVQLHDLREAVIVWSTRYGQRAWLRQLDRPVTSEMEDAVLRTIARMDGTPFPSTTRLASRWLSGRVPPIRRQTGDADLETAYCAEVLAVTYRAMGLLSGRHGSGWYDAGRFWSGDHLRLSDGFMLGGEIAVHVPPGLPRSPDIGGLPAAACTRSRGQFMNRSPEPTLTARGTRRTGPGVTDTSHCNPGAAAVFRKSRPCGVGDSDSWGARATGRGRACL